MPCHISENTQQVSMQKAGVDLAKLPLANLSRAQVSTKQKNSDIRFRFLY